MRPPPIERPSRGAGEEGLVFEVCHSLIAFDETRIEAMREMLGLSLDKHRSRTRDFFLERIFLRDSMAETPEENMRSFASLIREHKIVFSSKRMENLVRKVMADLETDTSPAE